MSYQFQKTYEEVIVLRKELVWVDEEPDESAPAWRSCGTGHSLILGPQKIDIML